MITIGEKLRMLRMSRNYTQEEMSRFTNMNRAAYANYELDRRTPTIFFLITIADFYGISVDYLVRSEYTRLPIPFSADERKLLIRYRTLDYQKRQTILACPSLQSEQKEQMLICPFLGQPKQD